MKEFKNFKNFFQILDNSNKNLSWIFKSILFINTFTLIGCSNFSTNKLIDICSNYDFPCLANTVNVLFITNKGKIELELYGELAPLTVGNFIDLIDKGAYDKTFFDRAIKDPKPFIISGGYNISVNEKYKDLKISRIRYLPLEIKLKSEKFPTYGKLLDEPSQIDNIELKHNPFSISMARSKDLNSASTQFYISLKSLPELDGRFAVFGKVINGINVLDLLEEKDFIIKAKKL